MSEIFDPTEYRESLTEKLKQIKETHVSRVERARQRGVIGRDATSKDQKRISQDVVGRARADEKFHRAKLLKHGNYETNEAGEMVDKASGLTTEQLAQRDKLYFLLERTAVDDAFRFLQKLQQEGKELPAQILESERTKKKLDKCLKENLSNLYFDFGYEDEDEDDYGGQKKDLASHKVEHTEELVKMLHMDLAVLDPYIISSIDWFIKTKEFSGADAFLKHFPSFDKTKLNTKELRIELEKAAFERLNEVEKNTELSWGYFSYGSLGKLFDYITPSEELKHKIKKVVIELLKRGALNLAVTISDEIYKFRKEELNDDEFQEAIKLAMGIAIDEIRRNEISSISIETVKKVYHVTENDFQLFLLGHPGVISNQDGITSTQPVLDLIDLQNSVTITALKERMKLFLLENKAWAADGIIRHLELDKQILLGDEEFQKTVVEAMKNSFKLKDGMQAWHAKKIATPESLANPEVHEAAKQHILYALQNEEIMEQSFFSQNIENFSFRFGISPEELKSKDLQEAIITGLCKVLSQADMAKYKLILREYSSDDYESGEIKDPRIKETAKQGAVNSLAQNHTAAYEDIVDHFHLDVSELQVYGMEELVEALSHEYDQTVERLKNKLKLEDDLTAYKGKLRRYLDSLISLHGFKTVAEVSQFIKSGNHGYMDYLKETPDQPSELTKDDLDSIPALHINLYEAEVLKRSGIEIAEIAETGDYSRLFVMLVLKVDSWKDEPNVVTPFRHGIEVFGIEKMFAYIDKPNVSRHDALHAFVNISVLLDKSGLTPDQFYGNILAQVNKDDAQYEAGTSYHQINALAQSFPYNPLQILEKARTYSDIPMLQELVSTYKSNGDIFQSWKHLKRFMELSKVLEQTEILDQLKELKQEGKDKLYNYIERLAFHPSSNVDMKSVVQFWKRPDRFFDVEDTHTPREVHDRKKPSNYTDIPNLDLTAEQLRDALVEGSLDTLQVFKPLEIEYEFAKNPSDFKDFRNSIKEALGSRKDSIPGEAKNVGKLFNELKRYFAAFSLLFEDYLAGTITEIPESLQEQASSALYNSNYGIVKPKVETIKITAKINMKSDPDGVLAGNDTACCMPFGSGKNNVYTFNPDTSLFTIQVHRVDGDRRTIAQSVLTKDKDVKTNVEKIVKNLNVVGEHMDQIVSEDILIQTPNILSCDNVEVAPNFKSAQFSNIIEAVYRDFFKEYFARHGKDQNFDQGHVVIGMGYSDTLTHLLKIDNTYVPAAPVGYSDKTAAEVYNLPIDQKYTAPGLVNKKVKAQDNTTQVSESPRPTQTGVELLTFEDTLPVAYLEGKAYSDNQSLITFLHNMENGLIAKDINNSAKGRPNMSIKYTDNTSKMRGYILAYEGVVSDEARRKFGADEHAVFVSDLATDKQGSITGGRLVQAFTELYKTNYLDKNNFVPVYAQTREQTSYRLIQRQLQRLSKDLNIDFDLEELPTYKAGNDIMHPVIIRPKQKASVKGLDS